ncbi:MAG: beta-ketoacyl-ACP synthase II [Spirochaetales bacterium]|nr:beta-ketoacyl-ACP synthase II [Spirochaetales bacterium]
MKRVVITGMGTVNPLAHNVNETWDKVLKGQSGIARIKRFDPSRCSSQVAGEVKDFNKDNLYFNPKKGNRLDDFVAYAAHALKEAKEQSGFSVEKNPWRVGITLGSGLGGIDAAVTNVTGLNEKGISGISPMYIPQTIGNIAAGFLSMEYGFKGPNMSMQTACATANHSIATALMIIQSGQADVMVAGGTESGVNELIVGAFGRMRALSTKYNDTPETASRPYDLGRDGFVIAEGAAVLILEEYEHARERGAEILCEVFSVGMSGDAYDLVMPDPEGNGAYHAMKSACEMAKINPSELNYINAHGTSTPLGDIGESKGIYKLVGDDQSRLSVGSTKSMHGHLLGATAGLEAIFAVKSVMDNKIPANINIENLDPDVAVSCINTEVVEREVNYALSNSFGFGGHNSSLIVGKVR